MISRAIVVFKIYVTLYDTDKCCREDDLVDDVEAAYLETVRGSQVLPRRPDPQHPLDGVRPALHLLDDPDHYT